MSRNRMDEWAPAWVPFSIILLFGALAAFAALVAKVVGIWIHFLFPQG